MSTRWLACLLGLFLLACTRCDAHVGAPDVYVKATAGPYHLLVGVHPPALEPGAAGIDVRSEDPDVIAIAVSLPGQTAQPLRRFSSEQIFTGSVWVPRAGKWTAVLRVSGGRGEAETTIPIPSEFKPKPLAGRVGLNLLLGISAAACLACSALLMRRRRLVFIVAALPVCTAILIVATIFAVRRPPDPAMELTLAPGGWLRIVPPGRTDDLVEDHGHAMHLFAIRQPEMDVLLHLHPAAAGPGRFEVRLPAMAAGTFLIFADIVHRDGQLDTSMAQTSLPAETGLALTGDDSLGVVPGLSRSQTALAPGTTNVRLMDGYTMRLTLDAALHPRTGQLLRVALLDPAGTAPTDMRLYLGMSAHAAVVKTDGSVFAHIHPDGTVPMDGMEMAGAPSSEAAFPFGFPSVGSYRVFVQMKHGEVVETAAFDLAVTP